MQPYIFGKRNTIHIIDIRETVKGLLRAKRFIAQVVARGEGVLFVGTKRQARPQVERQAKRVEMPYVTERWLGGTLTNFRTIRSRLARLEELEAAESDGTALEYSKKMIATRTRELRKIRRNLQGIREMTKLPGALIIIDVHREHNAVREAKKLGIPTVCLIDTDSDPDFADVPIPGNDDAIRAIDTVLEHLGDAVEEGIKGRTAPEPEDTAPGRRGQALPAARPAARPAEGQAAAQGEGVQAPAGETSPSAQGGGSTAPAGAAGDPDTDMTPATATDPEAR